jgi:protein-tyrosine-phosphatase
MRTTTIALAILLMVSPACKAQNTATRADTADPVVFVCEHGSVKSLIAASLFDRAAEKRGLPFRAISRGVSPDDAVPPRIAAALREDGFEVEGFRPQGLATNDVARATRVVAIGVDLTVHADVARVPIQSWDDVPAASVDYAAARATLQRHIDDLLDDLQEVERAP